MASNPRDVIHPEKVHPFITALREHWMVALPVLLLIAVAALAMVKLVDPAPPSVIYLVSGPAVSSFHNTAKRYKKIIERYGVKVEILESAGGLDNLRMLADPASKADVAFVQGGLTDGVDISNLVSLGSLFVQPVMLYCRGSKPVLRLTELTGKRLAVGEEGTGTRALVVKLLTANGIGEKNSTLLALNGEEAVNALLTDKVDAAFLTGDSATNKVQRMLREAPGIELASFEQAEAYRRKFRFLSQLTLPEGAMDLARNYPSSTRRLLGPTVELVAKRDLHPALSDLLIAAAREVHGRPGMFREPGQFPVALEGDFPISPEAERFYKSGGKVLYKWFPFWLASIADRLVVVILPLLVLLIPASKVLPSLYSWRVRSRIYRWYGALMRIERETAASLSHAEQAEIIARIDAIERAVNEMKTPPSFADQLYVLRGHVAMVRDRLKTERHSGEAGLADRREH